MKFLQLKDALEKILPKAEPSRKPEQHRPELPVVPFYSPREKTQSVVGGELLRTPVNKQAAMVVARAPWWAKPPPEPFRQPPLAKPQQIIPKPRKEKRMSESPQVQKHRHPAESAGITPGHKKSNVEVNTELATEMVDQTESSIGKSEDLVKRAMDARAALDVMCDYWREDWFKFFQESERRLADFRMLRMSFDTETKLLMTALKDVRQFFVDKDHDKEMARLKEFVEVCERLKALKDSGFLDTVADTMLKLS